MPEGDSERWQDILAKQRARQQPPTKESKWPRIGRDAVLASLGAYGFMHAVHATDPSEAVLMASLALLGAPIALRMDEKRNGGE